MTDNVAKLIDALQQGDMAAANSVFQDDLGARVSSALDDQKVAVAQNVFGAADEIESDTSDEEWDALADEDAISDEELDLELEDSEEEE